MKRKLPEGDNFSYIDINSVNNKTNTIKPKVVSVKHAPSRATRATKKGDIVFSMVRPYLRNIAQVPRDGCIASTGFYIFSSTPTVYSAYAFYILISDFVVMGLNSYMKGDNSPSITSGNVENFIIPLPPLNEQRQIVAKIEELFSVLDSIDASLQS